MCLYQLVYIYCAHPGQFKLLIGAYHTISQTGHFEHVFKNMVTISKKCIFNIHDFKYMHKSKRKKEAIAWNQDLVLKRVNSMMKIVHPLHCKNM